MKINDSIHLKRIAILYSMGFLLIFGYSFARPCIDSIFLEHYSNDDLPFAWLLVSVASAFIIAIYNRFNQRYSLLSLYGSTSIICSITLLILLVAYAKGFIIAAFILYIWKELYMVVLVETYWSFADIVFSTKSARKTYGFAMAISSFGGIVGNLLVGPAAQVLGTFFALTLLILFLIMGFFIAWFSRTIGDEKPESPKSKTDVGLGLSTLFSSKYLVPLAILACTAQVVTGLIDYDFNGMLKENITNMDQRTHVLGQIHAAVNVIGISFQLCMGPILKIFGIGNTFKSIPLLMSVGMIAFVALPQFFMMVALKITNKALDYSLFRGVKELLYIPLTRAEKTQGKGLIDIFIYRLARGFSSLLLMGMMAVGLTSYTMELSLGLALFWLVLAFVIVRRYQSLTRGSDHP